MRNRGDLSVVRQIGGVVEFADLKHGPYLGRHLRFNGRANEEGLWLGSGLRKRCVDSSQGRAGSLPVFIRSCRINTAFHLFMRRLELLFLSARTPAAARTSVSVLNVPCCTPIVYASAQGAQK